MHIYRQCASKYCIGCIVEIPIHSQVLYRLYSRNTNSLYCVGQISLNEHIICPMVKVKYKGLLWIYCNLFQAPSCFLCGRCLQWRKINSISLSDLDLIECIFSGLKLLNSDILAIIGWLIKLEWLG